MGFLAAMAAGALTATTATAGAIGSAAAATGGAIASGAEALGSAVASAPGVSATAGAIGDAGSAVGKNAASFGDSAYTVGKDVLKETPAGQFGQSASKLVSSDAGGGWTKGNIEQATAKGFSALMSGGGNKQAPEVQALQSDPGYSSNRTPTPQLSQSQPPAQLRGFNDYLTEALQKRM